MIKVFLIALISSLGYCIIFNIRGKHLIGAALGGAISWVSYYLFTELGFSELFAMFLSSTIISIYSEVLARVILAPVTTFIIVALIPLVPGAKIYYTMYEAINGNFLVAMETGVDTLAIAGTLALGVIFVSPVIREANKLITKNRKAM